MFRNIAHFLFFKILKFKLEGNISDDLKKFVLIAAPHTSWFDFPMGLIIRTILDKDIRFIGKDSLFKGPFGFLFYSLGGYPINRSEKSNMVDSMVQIFNLHDKFAVALSPEGTRKRVSKFKSGFYYIAKGAKVPIIMVQLDFGNKKIVVREPFYPTEDVEKDISIIWNYFKGVKGKIPKNSIV